MEVTTKLADIDTKTESRIWLNKTNKILGSHLLLKYNTRKVNANSTSSAPNSEDKYHKRQIFGIRSLNSISTYTCIFSESALHADLIMDGSSLGSSVRYISLLVSSMCEFDIKNKPLRSNLEDTLFISVHTCGVW